MAVVLCFGPSTTSSTIGTRVGLCSSLPPPPGAFALYSPQVIPQRWAWLLCSLYWTWTCTVLHPMIFSLILIDIRTFKLIFSNVLALAIRLIRQWRRSLLTFLSCRSAALSHRHLSPKQLRYISSYSFECWSHTNRRNVAFILFVCKFCVNHIGFEVTPRNLKSNAI